MTRKEIDWIEDRIDRIKVFTATENLRKSWAILAFQRHDYSLALKLIRKRGKRGPKIARTESDEG